MGKIPPSIPIPPISRRSLVCQDWQRMTLINRGIWVDNLDFAIQREAEAKKPRQFS
jgi:hypothetical protein